MWMLQPAQPHPVVCQNPDTPIWEYRIGDARNKQIRSAVSKQRPNLQTLIVPILQPDKNFLQGVDSMSTPTLPAHSKVRDLIDLYSTISVT